MLSVTCPAPPGSSSAVSLATAPGDGQGTWRGGGVLVGEGARRVGAPAPAGCQVAGASAPTSHIEKNWEPPPYACPNARLAPST
ncbi:hypothetical protein Scani_46020 [Streptomyces caniferus]|uniref:Uncharacterized protein n=1 Tax=Streptomyces caniferus TaxID=285557 RepID=A0A640SBX6_9ACTN|nr:hypothetical protein Scani_46020 [Streptomyces caniferus]